jgi:hypothetical protein
MLEEAHKCLEAMSTAANAVKDEEWGAAERALMQVQEIAAACCAKWVIKCTKRC